jgi:hypothetical protein
MRANSPTSPICTGVEVAESTPSRSSNAAPRVGGRAIRDERSTCRPTSHETDAVTAEAPRSASPLGSANGIVAGDTGQRTCPPTPQTHPAGYVCKSPSDFIGPAADIVKIFATKADELRQAPSKTKILLHGPPGTAKTTLTNWLALRLTEHQTSIECVNGRDLRIDTEG